jgi:murein DD-endopeptidase MepM/ murein hydrolase activator NlpD
MKKSLTCLTTGFLVLILAGMFLAFPARAALLPQYTPIATPTPGPDGRIIYIVQEGDTLWRISAITGVSVDELRRLNDLSEGDVINPGDLLLLGMGGPASLPPTPAPAPTPTVPPPLLTQMPGVGVLCISVFDDTNGDALRQDNEHDLSESAISVSNRDGTVSLSSGNGLVPRCYEDVVLGIYDIPGSQNECISIVYCALELQQGDYNVSVGIPEGYNATTALNYLITLEAGYQEFLDFGAQHGAQTLSEAPAISESGNGRSPILAVAGFGLLVIGIGLGIAAFMTRK